MYLSIAIVALSAVFVSSESGVQIPVEMVHYGMTKAAQIVNDSMAEQSRAVSTYVRETEDIEAKVSSLYATAIAACEAEIAGIEQQQLRLVASGQRRQHVAA